MIEARLALRKKLYLKAKDGKLKANGRILVVGDRPGPGHPIEEDFHFTPFGSDKHCSAWLNKQLEAAGVGEDRLVWLNAFNEHDQPLDHSVLDVLKAPVIIVLGGNAERWLKPYLMIRPKQRWAKFAHPQWHKRFNHGAKYELIEALVELTGSAAP